MIEVSFVSKKKCFLEQKEIAFLTKEEATAHFVHAEKIAVDKYEKIILGINKLKEEVGNFSYDCDVKVLDDSGLETTMYIEFNVDGYDFRFNLDF